MVSAQWSRRWTGVPDTCVTANSSAPQVRPVALILHANCEPVCVSKLPLGSCVEESLVRGIVWVCSYF